MTSESEYRKTATIKASQWFKDGDHPAVVMKTAPNRYADEGIPWIETLEGGHVVTPGDWIATGAEGEHWPIKPDIFAKTYVPDDGRNSRNLSDPVSPLTADLHRDTALLVNSFSIALAHKLLAAQKKYGFTNGWYTDDWEDKCRADLLAHVAKGDPLDVAAYAAFCWARCWSTATPQVEAVAWRTKGPRGGWMHSDVLPSSWRNAEPLYTAPPPVLTGEGVREDLSDDLMWAIGRWKAEVEHRPIQNKNRRPLDDAWRQVIRYFGGNPEMLLPLPDHDTILAALSPVPSQAVEGEG